MKGPQEVAGLQPQQSLTTEEQAMLGDRAAMLRVVSALRLYRAAAAALLVRQYRDGACDGMALSDFEGACEAIESDMASEDDD